MLLYLRIFKINLSPLNECIPIRNIKSTVSKGTNLERNVLITGGLLCRIVQE